MEIASTKKNQSGERVVIAVTVSLVAVGLIIGNRLSKTITGHNGVKGACGTN